MSSALRHSLLLMWQDHPGRLPTRCRDNRPTHQRPAHPPMLLMKMLPTLPLHWQQLRQFGKRPRCQLLRPRQVRSHRSPSRRT